MICVLLISKERVFLSDLAAELEINKINMAWAENGRKALSLLAGSDFDLVITDELLEDMTGLELIEKLIAVNPMINCVAVSSLSPKEFHKASEGLGILVQLPPRPDKKHTQNMLDHLGKILNLTKNNLVKKGENS